LFFKFDSGGRRGGWGEMRPCVQYIGELRLKSASCGRISPVRQGWFHTVGVATDALLQLVVGVGEALLRFKLLV